MDIFKIDIIEEKFKFFLEKLFDPSVELFIINYIYSSYILYIKNLETLVHRTALRNLNFPVSLSSLLLCHVTAHATWTSKKDCSAW